MSLFESMESSFNQSLITVVLYALHEGHPGFGNACYIDPPTGKLAELIDEIFISVNHKLKASNIHHFKGRFRTGATSADIFFLCRYRIVGSPA